MLNISPELELPEEAVTQTFAILAKRGVGKTYTANVMAEEMIKASLPIVIVDPIGVWWGLRTSADGESEGLKIVIAGGDHADVPITPESGEVIANLVVDEPISLVIDLSLMRKGEQHRFMVGFAETLYHRNRTALHLILDEADEFAPQRPMGQEARMLGAIEDLVRRGRARGIGVTLITQRPAVLNKNVLTQIEVLMAMRMTSPQDRKAIEEWVNTHGDPQLAHDMINSLPSLPIGQAWFWSPGWLEEFKLIKIRRRETLDSSSTPKAGQVATEARATATVDLEALKERLAHTIERMEDEDPKVMRQRITDLQKKLREAQSIKEVIKEVPVLPKEAVKQLADTATELIKMGESIMGALRGQFGPVKVYNVPVVEPEKLGTGIDGRMPDVTKVERFGPLMEIGEDVTGKSFKDPDGPPDTRSVEERWEGPNSINTAEKPHLKAGARKILEILARHHPMKVTRSQAGMLSGFRITGGTFKTYWSVLVRAGYIAEEGSDVWVTPAGLEEAGVEAQEPLTTEEVVEMWHGVLKAGARAMLDIVIDEYPKQVTRDQLAEFTAMTVSGGTFKTYLSVLRRNGLVEEDGDMIRASEALFKLEKARK